MKKIVIFVCLTTLLTVNAQVINTHPRIYLDPATITNLQSRAVANTPEWQQIQNRVAAVSGYTAADILDDIYSGEQYAFIFALHFYATGNTASRDTAISLFEEYFYNYTSDSSMYWDSGYESRNTLPEIATLYDWMYNYMSPQFRNDVRTRLVLWADWILYHPGIYGQFGTAYYFEGNNYCIGHLLGITATAYAIHSEDAVHGDRYIEVSDSVLPLMIDFSNTRLHNGDANEGWGYGAGYAVNFFKTLAIVKTATIAHINLFDSTSYDEGVIRFLPFATLPNKTHMLAEGDWARESTGEIWDYNRIGADLVSTYGSDLNTQRMARYWGNEVLPVNNFVVTSLRWLPFLFSNQEITSLDYTTQIPFSDLHYYTDTIGTDQFIQRTGWNTNSQWISYRGGGRYGDHAHNGVGHFSMYENGWLLIDRNIQSASGINGPDNYHNVVQVETMSDIEMYPFNDYPTAEHVTEKQMEVTNAYSYFWSDLAPVYLARESYNVGELNVVVQKQRQFFYLPGIKKMAIFDMVETELPTDDKTFTTHFWGVPTLGGYTARYSNTNTTAFVTTCYPIGVSNWISGQTLYVQNPIASNKNYFMHLVHTQPVSTTMNPVFPVNQDAGNVQYAEFYGSFHQENDTSNGSYVLLFNGNDPTYQFDSLSYRIPVNTSEVQSYLMGVEPNHTYYVKYELLPLEVKIYVYYNNIAGTTAHTATDAGVLFFGLGPLPVSVDNINDVIANIFYNSNQSAIHINSLQSLGLTDITLTNLQGQVIMNKRMLMNETQLVIPVEKMSAGIYMITLITESGTITRKLYIS